MKRLIFTLVIFFTGTARSDISGALFINADNTKAKLLINEAKMDGNLSQLFDQMKIEASGTETKRTKSFQMSNGRFSFVCNKGVVISSPPTTSCTFVIKAGENTGDISTSIARTNGQKVATVGMTQTFAQELDGIFPADSNGITGYFLETTNGLSLEARGTSGGNFTIGFSGR